VFFGHASQYKKLMPVVLAACGDLCNSALAQKNFPFLCHAATTSPTEDSDIAYSE
jgi:hypothetical protein